MSTIRIIIITPNNVRWASHDFCLAAWQIDFNFWVKTKSSEGVRVVVFVHVDFEVANWFTNWSSNRICFDYLPRRIIHQFLFFFFISCFSFGTSELIVRPTNWARFLDSLGSKRERRPRVFTSQSRIGTNQREDSINK